MSNQGIRIAIPHSHPLDAIKACFEGAGFDISNISSQVICIVDPFETGFNLELFSTSPTDVCRYVERGVCHAGIASTEVLRETGVEVWRPFTFNIESYPIVLVGKKGQSFKSMQAKPSLRLTTPFPKYVRDWFSFRGLAVELIEVAEGSEIAMELSMADGFIDLLRSPESILEKNFRVMEVLGYTRLKLIVNRALASKRRATVGKLIERFQEFRPPAPATISIPFDDEI